MKKISLTTNKVNMYVTSNTSTSWHQAVYDNNVYVDISYYSSEICKYNSSYSCITLYA